MNYNNGQMTPMQPMQPMDQRMQQLQQMQQMGQQMQQMSPQVGMSQGGVAPSLRPMEPMAQQMAQQGRYGDSMLVHMNPVEVAGIASLSPTGSLTTNPMTGQPEAFLPFLLPLMGSMFAPAAFTALGGGATAGLAGLATTIGANSALAGAIGSGLATTAVTGDIKKGLMSGLTGYGIGSALGATKDLLGGVTGAETALARAEDALAAGEATAATQAVQAGTEIGTAASNPALANLQSNVDLAKSALPQFNPEAATTAPAGLFGGTNAVTGEATKGVLTSGEGLKALGSNLMKPSTLLPIGVGEGQRLAMEAQEARDAQFGATEAERKRRLDEAQGVLDQSLGQIATDYGYDYGRSYQAGGITSVNPSDYQRRMADFQQMGMQQPMRMNEGGPTDEELAARTNIAQNSFGGGGGGFGFNPAARQASLRGPITITPQELEGYRPGIDPEINYFRKPPVEIDVNSAANVAGRAAEVERLRNDPIMNFAVDPNLSVEQKEDIFAIRQKIAQNAELRERGFDAQEGYSEVDAEGLQQVYPELNLDMSGQDLYSGIGGFNRSPYGTEYGMNNGGVVGMSGGNQVPSGEQAAQALIQQAAMALLGRMSEEESSVVIKRFVDQFGTEAFQQLRSQVLESVVPNSQKEGLIQGAGGGMDDQIGGMIGDQQKVAVSPGEFIVPGDVVSGLGDGDTGAGAKELAAMMDRVRTERTGTTKQPEPLVNVRGGGILPA